MEQHPVPQNVTSFQFRLIGDMTIKQFGYLAGGAILAFVFYKIPLPLYLNWPIAVTCALVGFGFAFVPIEERPMDVWVLSFFRNVYSPTVFVWQKSKPAAEPVSRPAEAIPTAEAISQPIAATVTPPAAPIAARMIEQAPPAPHIAPHMPQTLVSQTAATPMQSTDTRMIPQAPAAAPHAKAPTWNPTADTLKHVQAPPMPIQHGAPATGSIQTVEVFDPFAILKKIFHWKTAGTTSQSAQPAIPTPTASKNWPSFSDVKKAEELQHKALEEDKHTKEIEDMLAQAVIPQQQAGTAVTDTHIVELQKKLQDALLHKKTLEEELHALKTTMTPTTQQSPTVSNQQAATGPSTITSMSAQTAAKAGLPRLTTFPNVITGIIKDVQGNLLPGILITVRDAEDVPLRALKTNRLGQFAASTPLPSGTYLVEIEDPKKAYVFDRAQITLNGSVMPALEVIAKSQKELSREKLAQELFGNQKM